MGAMNKFLTATAAVVGVGVAAFTLGAIGPVNAQTAPPPSTSSSAAAPADAHDAGWLRARVRERFIREAASVSADKIGVTVKDLREAVRNGQSVAEVVAAHNVDPGDVKTAIVDDISAKIDQAVTNGHLKADRAAKLEER